MPRTSNFPDTTDEVKSISLAYLRESGLLQPGATSTTLSWSRNSKPTGRITLEVRVLPDSEPCLRLKYTHNETTPLDYYVPLEALPNNRPGRYPNAPPRIGQAGYHSLLIRGHRLFCPPA